MLDPFNCHAQLRVIQPAMSQGSHPASATHSASASSAGGTMSKDGLSASHSYGRPKHEEGGHGAPPPNDNGNPRLLGTQEAA